MDEITQALLDGKDMEVGAARTILQYAVMTAITCPYSGEVLDMRRAVLLDGSDNGGRMDLLCADCYDLLLSKTSLDELQTKLGYKVDVYDGRVLFS